MESKRNRALRLMQKEKGLFLCPVCGEKLTANDDYTLSCSNGHSFDISKKGTINLVGSGNDKVYDDILFKNRRDVISGGSYDPLIKALAAVISNHFCQQNRGISILDAGCGEGSFLNRVISALDPKCKAGLLVGTDLSKSGINLASDHENDIIWSIDDLANLHISSAGFDVILNILSPANYQEFKRLIKKDGIIIKVIPGRNYLKEFRDASDYDNTDTIKHTEDELTVIDRSRLEYVLAPDQEELASFIKMTPMNHGKSSDIENKKIHGLTIDFEIITGQLP